MSELRARANVSRAVLAGRIPARIRRRPRASRIQALRKWGLICLFVYLAIMLGIQEIRLQRVRIQVDGLRRQIVTVTEQNKALQQQVDLLEDPDYVERLAREELGLVRPGEIQYVEIEPDGQSAVY